MKPWMIFSGICMILAVSLVFTVAYDMRNHPERTYAVACAPGSFVVRYHVDQDTYAVCGAPPFEEVKDFRIIKMP